MVWSDFQPSSRSASTCSCTEFRFAGTWDQLPLAVRDALAETRFTTTMLSQSQGFWSAGQRPTEDVIGYMRDLFETWGDPNSPDDMQVKGDVSEVSFCRIRTQSYPGNNVVQRTKRETSSSRSPGWDVVELFLSQEPFFILWEVKGTDEHPERQSRSAARQVMTRSRAWLAMLAGLLEAELGSSHGKEAGRFGAKVHELAVKRDRAFHIGVAVVVDKEKLPPLQFEMFHPQDSELPPDQQWGVLVGVPDFKGVRRVVARWMLAP